MEWFLYNVAAPGDRPDAPSLLPLLILSLVVIHITCIVSLFVLLKIKKKNEESEKNR